MTAKNKKQSSQPKWMSDLRVFLMRHTHSALNNQNMIITTTERSTGHQHAEPITYIHDGGDYIAISLGRSEWYLNARANPHVKLEVDGKKFDAFAQPISTQTPDDTRQVLDIFARERPELYKSIFGLTYKTPSDEDVIKIQKRIGFIRFCPIR